MDESVLRRYAEKLQNNLSSVTQQFLITQSIAEDLQETVTQLNETLQKKDVEIKKLTTKLASFGEKLAEKDELIKEKNEKIEGFVPRKGTKHAKIT